MIRILLIFVSALVFALNLQAQDSTSNNWQTEDDFRQAEPLVKQNILWLEENPLSTSSNDTKAMTEYVLIWLTNTPYLIVTYDEVFLEGLMNTKKYKFGEKFRVTYLFGKSYFIISHPDDSDEANASARGIEGMVKVYQELKKIDPSVRHRILEKYSRLVRSKKTGSYTRSQLSKDENKSL